MVSESDLSAALTLGVVGPLPDADAEVLKQRLDALVVDRSSLSKLPRRRPPPHVIVSWPPVSSLMRSRPPPPISNGRPPPRS
jgi:hypothetical protein